MILHAERWHGSGASAPTVVCLHGITSWAGRFRRLASDQLPAWNVVALDLRGHGSSGWEPPWDIEAHLADIVETVGTSASWIGHSFGGRLVVELAARHPELVGRAVLLDPAVAVKPRDAFAQAEAVRPDQRFGSLEEYVDSRLAGKAIFKASKPFLLEELADDLVRAPDGRGLVARFCRSAAVTGWSEMATPSSPMPLCPTLVITGEQSWMRYELPSRSNVTVVTVPGGHSILWDASAEAGREIGRFLRQEGG